MTAPGWRTALIVHGLSPAGHAPPVVIGLIEGANGGVLVALRVGDGEPVILPLLVATQLIANIRQTLGEQLKLTGQTLGGDEP